MCPWKVFKIIALTFSYYSTKVCSVSATCLLSDQTTRLNIVITSLWQINSQRLCCCLIHLMWMWLTRTSITSLQKQPKRLSDPGIKTTIFRVGMQSVKSFYRTFLQSPQGELKCGCYSFTCQSWQETAGSMVQSSAEHQLFTIYL